MMCMNCSVLHIPKCRKKICAEHRLCIFNCCRRASRSEVLFEPSMNVGRLETDMTSCFDKRDKSLVDPVPNRCGRNIKEFRKLIDRPELIVKERSLSCRHLSYSFLCVRARTQLQKKELQSSCQRPRCKRDYSNF